MNLKETINMSMAQQERFDDLYGKYRNLTENPDCCEPLFIINTPVEGLPSWEARLQDPLLMLKAGLDALKPHLEMADDRVPTVRVEFGTAQIAAAFGCDLFIPTNNLPCAGNHVLKNAEDVFKLDKPALEAGWYGKLKEWTALFQENLPTGVHLQHPDIQSAFNSAHLIRGNDILTDFYDDPESVNRLLDLVTDYMIELVPWLKSMISTDRDWFFDWGALWKGSARISNCSMHMISPRMYLEHIFPRDRRFLQTIGGGRIHYCGTNDEVIDEFFKIPELSGLDYDSNYHDFYSLCERAPERVVLLQSLHLDSQLGRDILTGKWPVKKRNVIFMLYASSVEEGRNILPMLRKAARLH